MQPPDIFHESEVGIIRRVRCHDDRFFVIVAEIAMDERAQA